MKKRRYPAPPERIKLFRTAWEELAPEASFSGMTLQKFVEDTQPLLDNEAEIKRLEALTEAALRKKDELETKARRILRNVGRAVSSDAGHGEDSPLYSAMGFVPFSERKSGLTRRSKSTESPPADPPVDPGNEAA
ncbi:hypothetical protein [Haloferula sargassicola]|uniref:Transposase n=1 Tax=Haloferula sargassicola TaxID=490096 RepID=A0ABP9UNP0_9BACT